MRKRFTTAAVAAAAAGGFAVMPFAAASAAPAAPAHASSIIGDPASKDVAGYQTGRWTRVITATFNLPSNTACAQNFAPRSPQGAGFAITLGSAEQATTGTPLSAGAATALGLSFTPSAAGCGLISPSLETNLAGPDATPEPLSSGATFHPGDNVTLALYYNLSGHFTTGVANDNTTGVADHGAFDAAATYKAGSAAAGYGPFTPQGGRVKLWAVKNVRMTTYTGHSGAIGAFAPARITMTSDGTASGTDYSDAGTLWNSGQNFSVFAH